MYTIYKLKFKNSDKLYIGQSNNPEVRYRQHINRAKAEGRRYSQRWINKHLVLGEELQMFYIDTAKSKAEADMKERLWIDYYKTLGLILTNLTEGGEGCLGYTHTEESKSKMSAMKKGKSYPHMFKATITPEQQAKMQESCKTSEKYKEAHVRQGKLMGAKNAKSYEIIYPDGSIETIHNLSEWCKENGIGRNNIKYTLNHPTRKYKGFSARNI